MAIISTTMNFMSKKLLVCINDREKISSDHVMIPILLHPDNNKSFMEMQLYCVLRSTKWVWSQ